MSLPEIQGIGYPVVPVTRVLKEVRYSPSQMFDLIASVERYPEFVPHWQDARISRRQENQYCTEQTIRVGPFQQRFSTETFLFPHEKIEVVSAASPFKQLRLSWQFQLAQTGGCRISLETRFELRSPVLQMVGGILSKESVARMIAAFEARAATLYGGPPCGPAV